MTWRPTVVMSAQDEAAMKEVLGGQTTAAVLTPVLMGLIVDSVFTGIMMCQMYHWMTHGWRTETRYIQWSTFWVFLIGFGVWLLSMCWTVHLFAFCYGRWHVWTEQQWLTWYPLLNAGMVLVAQVFYAERAYKLAGRGKWVVVLVLIPLLMSLAGAFGIVVEGMRYNKNFYGTFGWLWIVNLFVADFIVSFIVLWILFNERKSAEWQSTGHMIKRLIRIACESQLPPTILALALLIDFAVQGDTYYAVFFEMIQGKVYVLGMLYVLNSRFEMRKSARRPVTFGGPQYSGNSSTAAAVIHVQSDTYVEQHELKSPFSSTNRKILPRIRDASEDGSTPDLNSRIPEKQGDYPFGAIP